MDKSILDGEELDLGNHETESCRKFGFCESSTELWEEILERYGQTNAPYSFN